MNIDFDFGWYRGWTYQSNVNPARIRWLKRW